jgi:hypothetical protein
MQAICRRRILVDLVLYRLLVQESLVNYHTLVFVRRQIRGNEEVHMVLDQQLTSVTFWVLEVHV